MERTNSVPGCFTRWESSQKVVNGILGNYERQRPDIKEPGPTWMDLGALTCLSTDRKSGSVSKRPSGISPVWSGYHLRSISIYRASRLSCNVQ